MWLIHSGQVETAYERVLIVGTEKDLLRLMSKTSICLSLLSPNTKNSLFSVLSKMMKEGGNHNNNNNNCSSSSNIEYALPWILKAVKTGDALALRRSVRKELAGVLLELVNNASISNSKETRSHEKIKSTIRPVVEEKTRRPSGAGGLDSTMNDLNLGEEKTELMGNKDSSNFGPAKQKEDLSPQAVIE